MKKLALVAVLALSTFSPASASAQSADIIAAYESLDQGNNAFWNEDYAEAERLFRKALASQRGASTVVSAQAEQGLGLCFYARGRVDEAAALFASASAILELDDRQLTHAILSREYLARIKLGRKDAAGALRELDAAAALLRRQAASIPAEPSSLKSRSSNLADLRGRAFAALGRHADADAACAAGIKDFEDASNPHAPFELYACRADALAALGRAPESARMRKRAKESRVYHARRTLDVVAQVRAQGGMSKLADAMEKSAKEALKDAEAGK